MLNSLNESNLKSNQRKIRTLKFKNKGISTIVWVQNCFLNAVSQPVAEFFNL